jgi:shikimate dehydrogenase
MKNIHNIYGVCGKPVLHSKSPYVFKILFNRSFLFDSYYIRLSVNTAEEAVNVIRSLDIKGINVTAPFKQDIIEYIDYIDRDTKIISAVNLILNDGNQLKGYNYDHLAVSEVIKKYKKHIINFNCLVIGAGGAGRAAAFAMVKDGYDVTIINRTNEKAQIAANELNCKFSKWSNLEEEIANAGFCINTLPRRSINLDRLFKIGQIVLMADYSGNYKDSNFNPIDGRYWLVEQAYMSYRKFTGFEPSKEIPWYETTKNNRKIDPDFEITKKENISLIGFIGSGKTSIGKALAQKMSKRFIDTDEMIVEKEQMPIKEIFREKGDEYFRNLEREILIALKSEKNLVISCGGGMIINEENRKILKEISNVFWIYSPVQTCINRLENGLRPPLTNPFENIENSIEKAEILFNHRIPYYCEIADTLIFNNNTIEKAADKIYEEIHTYFGS